MLGNSTRGLLPFQNDYYIKHVFFLLLYIAYFYSTSQVPLYFILFKSLEKYNEELPYELLVLFIYLPPGKLRLLLVLFLFISIWTRLVAINK